jgi:hypothetical protein
VSTHLRVRFAGAGTCARGQLLRIRVLAGANRRRDDGLGDVHRGPIAGAYVLLIAEADEWSCRTLEMSKDEWTEPSQACAAPHLQGRWGIRQPPALSLLPSSELVSTRCPRCAAYNGKDRHYDVCSRLKFLQSLVRGAWPTRTQLLTIQLAKRRLRSHEDDFDGLGVESDDSDDNDDNPGARGCAGTDVLPTLVWAARRRGHALGGHSSASCPSTKSVRRLSTRARLRSASHNVTCSCRSWGTSWPRRSASLMRPRLLATANASRRSY